MLLFLFAIPYKHTHTHIHTYSYMHTYTYLGHLCHKMKAMTSKLQSKSEETKICQPVCVRVERETTNTNINKHTNKHHERYRERAKKQHQEREKETTHSNSQHFILTLLWSLSCENVSISLSLYCVGLARELYSHSFFSLSRFISVHMQYRFVLTN